MIDQWRRTTLGAVADVLMGQSPPGTSYNVEGVGLPFIQGSAEFGEHFPKPVKWCSQPAKVAQPGDLMVSVRAPVGDTNFADREIAIGRGLAVVRGREGATNRFLRLAVQHGVADLLARSGSGMFSSITAPNLKGFDLLLPPPEVQRRIVDLIGALDTHSDHLRSEADSLRTLLASVHRRLDEAAEWRHLREFANSDGIQIGPFGSQLHASDYVDEGLAVVMPQDMVDGTISDARIKRVAPGQAERLARHVLQEGDILFARRGDLTKRAWVGPEHAGGLCGTGSIRFRPRQASMAPALFEALSTERSSSWLLEHAVGTTMPNLNTQIISALPVPNLDEGAESCAASAAGIRLHLRLLSREVDATSGLRTILLNDLLSREVEVPEAYERLVDAGVA